MEKSTRTVLRGGNGGNAISLTRRFRRGRKFGTILVDLTTHAIIDLLPDRNAETAAAWMRLHPEIEVVSRDRGEDYASAARLGAPQARQVADRFHLAKNLTEIVEEILARCRAEIRKASKGTNPSSEQQAEDQECKTRLSSRHDCGLKDGIRF